MDRMSWDDIDSVEQEELTAYATAAMQALISQRPNIVEKAVVAETAWEMAEAMVQRRQKRTFSFREGVVDEPAGLKNE
jgi:hypothetical protein